MNAQRGIPAVFAASMAASVGLVVVYITGFGGPQLEGILLAVALGGVGIGIVVWAIALLRTPIESEERHELASSPEQREAAASALDLDEITRRRFLVRLLAATGAMLTAALALPAFSLGPQPGRALFVTGWSSGGGLRPVRLVDSDGLPIHSDDLVEQAVRTVFPEGAVGRADSPAMLIRVRPSDLHLPSDRLGMDHDGLVAYSKICTHAGCPVGLYRAQDQVLICPCHQSTFDVTRGALPVFGPAARRLPQLDLDVDSEGYLVARRDFDAPVGPSFWNLTHEPTGDDFRDRLEAQE